MALYIDNHEIEKKEETELFLDNIAIKVSLVFFYIFLILIMVLPFIMKWYFKDTEDEEFGDKEKKKLFLFISIWIACIVVCFVCLFLLAFFYNP